MFLSRVNHLPEVIPEDLSRPLFSRRYVTVVDEAGSGVVVEVEIVSETFEGRIVVVKGNVGHLVGGGVVGHL